MLRLLAAVVRDKSLSENGVLVYDKEMKLLSRYAELNESLSWLFWK